MPPERLTTWQKGRHVHVEDAAPLGDGHLEHSGVGIGGGVVDEHVERAEAVRHGSTAPAAAPVADVADDRVSTRSRPAKAVVLGEVEDPDARPLVEEAPAIARPSPFAPPVTSATTLFEPPSQAAILARAAPD